MKRNTATFDYTGQVDYLDVLDVLNQAFVDVTIGAGARVSRSQVDLSARSAYRLLGANPKTPHEKAVEYFLWDWEYSESPEVRHLLIVDWSSFNSLASYHRGLLRLGYGLPKSAERPSYSLNYRTIISRTTSTKAASPRTMNSPSINGDSRPSYKKRPKSFSSPNRLF